MTAFGAGSLVGMLAVGLLMGFLTVRYGHKHDQTALGWGGLAACLAGALALGILGSGPMALVFHGLIRRQAARAMPPAVPAWPDMRPERLPQ